MRVIADVVKEHDLFLVADEVYREFIYDDEPMGTFCEMEDIKDHVIVVDSISKRFSACGARIGSIISRNREFMAEAMKLCQGRLCTATLDQAGAAAMYEHVQPSYFKEVRDEYKKRRDAVEQDPRHQVPYAGRRLLHDGNAAGGRCGKASVFPAGGI